MTQLLIVLGVLAVLTWGYSMYAAWKLSQETAPLIADHRPIVALWERAVRLGRRGWYRVENFGAQGSVWISHHAAAVFVRCFPKSAPIFVKRDKLTGLTHGPSSYFLKRITLSPQERDRASRTKSKLVEQAAIVTE